MTKIYGHRGSKGNYPENSMLAFKKAIEAGVAGMELDIHLTKDNEIVVFHDSTLDRTSTGTGYIKDLTLAEIRQHTIGQKFTDFANYEASWDEEKIPTLAEVLELFKAHDIEVNIELKTYEFTYPGIEEKMLEVVKASGYDTDKVIYSSFHLPTLIRIQKLDEAAKVALLTDYYFLTLPGDFIDEFGWDGMHPGKDIVLKYPEIWGPVADKIRIWTVNDPEEMKTLIDMGVEAIVTDYPEIAVELVK